MKNIYLVGFMGSGKSTVGKILAEKLKMRFTDIDQLIEKEEGKAIPQIFKEKGEKYFRELEKKMLEKIQEEKNLVVSTGGGLGADRENMEKMKKNGLVVWLDVSFEEILKRCEGDQNRPLLNQPVEKIKKLYDKRIPIYKLAHIHIKTDNKKPEEIAEEIIRNADIHRN
ncbi:shikimate kinase [Persephonella hydrogeniphila]|uniref:Shikimate kinase n=1 Tax=Persephonella hydrogeniphila TaxID=198703 RepID=A0A285NG31_9AQUI|nr:shikimate kinase [Persephonella hydrogeniphila]SNZ08430.1 shikimate kinase [Persephonella hydrogeniphila]